MDFLWQFQDFSGFSAFVSIVIKLVMVMEVNQPLTKQLIAYKTKKGTY